MIVRVDPDETSTTVVADDLDFPNGMVITPDGQTLIVAESIGRRLTAFTIGGDGSLSDRADLRRRARRAARRPHARRRRRNLGIDDAGQPVRADCRGRHRDRPHRHG